MATSSDALTRMRGARLARVLGPFAVLAMVISGLGVAGSTATAAPTKTIQQVEAEVLALQQDAANAAEEWNAARGRQADIATKISSLRVRIAAAELTYGKVSGAVDAMARAAYASGGIDPSLQALLADNPQSFLDQTAALDQVARSQGTSLRRTQTARLLLAQLQVQLTQEQAAAQVASHDAANQKQAVADKLAAAQALLSSLKADERRKLEALAAARRAASVKAAQEAAAAATRAQNAARLARTGSSSHSSSSDNGNGGSNAGSGNGGGGNGGNGSPSSRARIAVAYALSKVGHRYVAGASGPGSFDCSGLTMAAWRAAGVSLPHYSYSQYGVTRHISRSELRPGDLLFYFGGSAHHVSMYIGGGMMVSASNPGAGVEIIAAFGPWYGERYSGAGRVV